jgi:hypothetical protein
MDEHGFDTLAKMLSNGRGVIRRVGGVAERLGEVTPAIGPNVDLAVAVLIAGVRDPGEMLSIMIRLLVSPLMADGASHPGVVAIPVACLAS